jgi:RecB family endonuclease NucS
MVMTDEEREAIRQLLAEGLSSEEVARRLGVPKMRVAAVRAHNTMGTYGGNTTSEALTTDDLEEAADAADLKFGLERDMQNALRGSIAQLDPSLRIVDGGKERHVEAGFIDILAEDGDGLVVIELKSGRAPDDVVTQVLSYVGALRAEESRPIRGVIVAKEFSTRVRFAAEAAGIRLVTYGYQFTFAQVGG